MKGAALLAICVALAGAKPREHEKLSCTFNEGTQFLPHNNCHQFYQCLGETPIVQTCPANLLFNTVLKICDWPSDVDCEGRVIPEDKPTNDGDNDVKPVGHGHSDPSLAPEICAAEDSDGVLVAHENCTDFYMCQGHHSVALKCPRNLMYNPKKEQCDWPQNVDCGERIIPELEENQDNHFFTDAEIACTRENSEGTLLTHVNCNRFYYCNAGKPVAFICPAGLMYSIERGYCDWPVKVECGDRSIAETKKESDGSYESFPLHHVGSEINQVLGYAVPTEAPAICADKQYESVLVAHENCTQYYQCTRGAPFTRDCPEGLFYHPEIEVCDWPENVDCGDRIKP